MTYLEKRGVFSPFGLECSKSIFVFSCACLSYVDARNDKFFGLESQLKLNFVFIRVVYAILYSVVQLSRGILNVFNNTVGYFLFSS